MLPTSKIGIKPSLKIEIEPSSKIEIEPMKSTTRELFWPYFQLCERKWSVVSENDTNVQREVGERWRTNDISVPGSSFPGAICISSLFKVLMENLIFYITETHC